MFSAIRNVIHDCTNQRRRRGADEDEQEKSTEDENIVDDPNSKSGNNFDNATVQTSEKKVDLDSGLDERLLPPTPPTPPTHPKQTLHQDEAFNELPLLSRRISCQSNSAIPSEPMSRGIPQMVDDDSWEDRLRCNETERILTDSSTIRRWRPVRCDL